MSLCLALFGLIAPVDLAGQACLGSHAPRGSVSLAGSVSADTDGDVAFSPSIAGNLPGPMFAGAGYTRNGIEDSNLDGNELALAFGAEALNDAGTSLCVHGRAGHSWVSGLPEGASVKGELIAGGGSVGHSFGRDVLVTPYGFVGVASVDASASVLGAQVAEEGNVGAALAAGVGIGTDRMQARPHISYITTEGSDPVFGLDVLASF
jgi:hypothetical protein